MNLLLLVIAVKSVNQKKNSALTIAMSVRRLEDYCANDAITDWETLKITPRSCVVH